MVNDTENKEDAVIEQYSNKNIVCTKCGATISETDVFCPKCGAPVALPGEKRFCAKCGAELLDGQDFCPKCGQKAGAPVVHDKSGTGISHKIIIPIIACAVIFVMVVSAVLIFNSSSVTNITLDKKTMSLVIDESGYVSYKIIPETEQGKKVKWETSDSAVAQVDADGKILAVGEGECTVSVSRKKKADTITIKVLNKFEGNMLKSQYKDAYEMAETDEQKLRVIAENVVAVESAYAVSLLKDRSSFVLNDAYYDEENKNIVLQLSGKNGFGARVSSYWLFSKNKNNEWEYFCSVSDLAKEEYKSYDDDDDKLEKLAKNMGREIIEKSMDKGYKLDKEAVARINSLFEQDKLDEIELIEEKQDA